MKGADGKLTPNAVVRISRLDANRNYPTKTDKKGHYFYNGLPTGLYTITVQVDGRDVGGVGGVLAQPGPPLVIDIFLGYTPEQQAESARQQIRKMKGEWSYVKPMIIPGVSVQASVAEPDRASAGAVKAGNPQPPNQQAELLKQRQSLSDAFNSGLAALDDKRYADAAVLFKKALEADSKLAIVWENLGAASSKLAATQSGAEAAASLQQALDGYAKAVELKPDEAVFHNNYALALARSGKYPQMQAEMKRCAELDPANTSHVYYNLGAVLSNAGQLDAAADEFKLAIAAAPEDPANAESYYQYALALMSQAKSGSDGKLIAAPGTVEALRKYLELAPSAPNSQAAKELLAAFGFTPENSKGGKKK